MSRSQRSPANRRRRSPGCESAPSDAEVRRRTQAAVAAVRAGDVDAFADIVTLYKVRLMSACVTLMRNRGAAEELAQDVFVRAYRYLDSYDERRDFYPWLAKIAYRLAGRRWAEAKRNPRTESTDELVERLSDGSPTATPDERLTGAEQARRLWQAVEKLPQGERFAVLLFYRQGMSVTDAADVMDVTPGAVKTWLYRARKHLRALLEREAVEDCAKESNG